MKQINHLHTNYDNDKGKFMNVELEKVSRVVTYSMVEGL
jgi:hypothetical protein